ncbi:MAG: hypothetical protein U0Q11_14340 [Vicinamibacterales bacterium]
MNTRDDNWFIDAWSVMDGYAFASRRTSDSLQADAVFFVGPPYFEPEPVASLATALAATRAHFQEGFRIEGQEVAFASLGDVVEAVRRAYRAGGVDLGGAPAPQAVRPRPARPGGEEVHPEALVSDELRDTWRVCRELLRDDCVSEERTRWLETKLSELIEGAFTELVPKFIGAAAEEMLVALVSGHTSRSTAARELSAWIDKAQQLGIRVWFGLEPPRLYTAVIGVDRGFDWSLPELRELPAAFVELTLPILYRSNGALVREFRIPYAVPIPAAFQHGASESSALSAFPQAPTMGHLLALATSDRWYVKAIDSVVEFVPIVVAALAQLPAPSLPFGAFAPVEGSQERRDVSRKAARWLARALPSGSLAENPVERAIHDFVVLLLSRTSQGRSARAGEQWSGWIQL